MDIYDKIIAGIFIIVLLTITGVIIYAVDHHSYSKCIEKTGDHIGCKELL